MAEHEANTPTSTSEEEPRRLTAAERWRELLNSVSPAVRPLISTTPRQNQDLWRSLMTTVEAPEDTKVSPVSHPYGYVHMAIGDPDSFAVRQFANIEELMNSLRELQRKGTEETIVVPFFGVVLPTEFVSPRVAVEDPAKSHVWVAGSDRKTIRIPKVEANGSGVLEELNYLFVPEDHAGGLPLMRQERKPKKKRKRSND